MMHSPTPLVQLAEGAADLLVCRDARISRWDAVKLFLQMETGAHVAHPSVEVYKTRRVRICPSPPAGHLQLSGEEIALGDTEIRVLEKFARVLC